MLVAKRCHLRAHKRGYCQVSKEEEKQRIKEKMEEMRRKAKEAKQNAAPRRPTTLGVEKLCFNSQ